MQPCIKNDCLVAVLCQIVYIPGEKHVKKYLACALMVCDHIGLYYSDRLPAEIALTLRIIGSMCLPLFAYIFVSGFFRTSSPSRYFLRLAITASVTQGILYILLPIADLPYDISSGCSLYILPLSFFVLYGCELLFAIPPDMIGSLRLLEANADTHSHRYDVRIGSGKRPLRRIVTPEMTPAFRFILGGIMIISALLIIWTVPIEYSLFGLPIIVTFYLTEKMNPKNKVTISFLCFLITDILYSFYVFCCTGHYPQLAGCLAVFFLCYVLPEGRKPSRIGKYAFYVFYPLHILLLLLLRLL